MAEAILYGLAQEILKNLKSTITTINNVLMDAEERQADSHAVRGWLQNLTAVVYAADDLFDEFATVASQKQLKYGNKFTKEVSTFLSSSNQIKFALSISQKIKTIREELDGIVKDSTEFAFVYRPREEGNVLSTSSHLRGRDQTYSFVDADEVIGREDDKRAILDILLESCESENEVLLHVIPIVGIGGLGKTTLAQLIYNDPQIEKYFELKLWVCVSEDFDMKMLTEKIIKSATNAETPNIEMDQLQGLLRKEVGDKRYLLVLDDVWNENREEWLKLRPEGSIEHWKNREQDTCNYSIKEGG
ncbi:putative disease resistance protein RGA3 [Spinacia oleracea]|uniref:Disease resistance protein RGA3 n=1 Tax=Spinacia oleracea TaxID=3562 RepID=A0ABM3R235_SPIOL|nr:putative disease resistance protein RGA3 [Spinacia oleracea]